MEAKLIDVVHCSACGADHKGVEVISDRKFSCPDTGTTVFVVDALSDRSEMQISVADAERLGFTTEEAARIRAREYGEIPALVAKPCGNCGRLCKACALGIEHVQLDADRSPEFGHHHKIWDDRGDGRDAGNQYVRCGSDACNELAEHLYIRKHDAILRPPKEPKEEITRDATLPEGATLNSVHNPSGTGANARQIGGAHYGLSYLQHWDIVALFDLDYFQGQVTKYLMRWKKKNGIQDLEKAAHFLEKYIEVEKAKANPS